MRLTIANKIAAAFLLLITAIVICLAVGWFSSHKLSNNLSFISNEAWNAADGAMETVILVQQQIITIQNLAVNPEQITEAKQTIKTLDGELKDTITRMLGTGLFAQAMVGGMEEHFRQFTQAKSALLRSYDTQDEPTTRLALQEDFVVQGKKLHGFLVKMEEAGDSKVESITSSIDSIVNESELSFLAILIFSFLFCAGIYWYINSAVASQLRKAAKFMHNVAQGSGDLTVRMDVKGNDEIADLGRAFNAFVEKMQYLITDLLNQSNQVAQSASQLSLITNQSLNSIVTQSSETDQVATAVQELAATAAEVARNAANTSQNTDLANEHADKGKKVVEATSGSIYALAREVDEAAHVVEQLEKESQNIGAVLDVIKSIAEQTNLLALNAAIEAARAGEQGRGFAVVADEVRSLASRTQQSTEEIENMIAGLQDHARRATQAMGHGSKQAEEAVKHAKQASASLDDINQSVSMIVDMNIQIASAAEEQAAVAEEVNRNVVNISQLSGDIRGAAQRVSESGQEMEELANRMMMIGNQFKV